jgi:hypothetical protein
MQVRTGISTQSYGNFGLMPNGPPSRDVGPQRPLTPHGKAEDTKQPADGGGDER